MPPGTSGAPRSSPIVWRGILRCLPAVTEVQGAPGEGRDDERREHRHDRDEAEDPRAELVRRLMEYEQMKIAGQKLNELPQAEREFFWVETLVEKSLYVRLPEVSLEDLRQAWIAVVRQASLNKHHKIGREELSVREHMGIILRVLRERGGFVQFETMFDPGVGVPGLVVHFLAMLELAREKLVEFTQTEAFQPIYVRVHQGGTEPGQESA